MMTEATLARTRGMKPSDWKVSNDDKLPPTMIKNGPLTAEYVRPKDVMAALHILRAELQLLPQPGSKKAPSFQGDPRKERTNDGMTPKQVQPQGIFRSFSVQP